MMIEICRELGADRVAVLTGVAPESQGASTEDLAGENVRVFRAEGCLPPHSAAQTARLLIALGRALATVRPSVLQYGTLEDAYLAFWTHKALRLRHVFYAHGNELLAALDSSWGKGRAALLASACVIANSRYTAEIVKSIGVRSNRVRIVHPGCDTRHFRVVQVDAERRLNLTRGKPGVRLLLTVGNLVERKGHDIVIQALARLGPELSDTQYLIAGDGPHRATLENLARSLGVAERVNFLGRVDRADLPLLYSAADLFVMVARERRESCDVEGFGIVFIEAAACGTPSIGGKSGGIEDAVVDGETGLLVDPLDVDAVAAGIARLLSDDAMRRRFGDRARDRAVGRFSWTGFAQQVAEILEEVADD